MSSPPPVGRIRLNAICWLPGSAADRGVFERSMPDLIRWWIAVRVKKTRQNKMLEPLVANVGGGLDGLLLDRPGRRLAARDVGSSLPGNLMAGIGRQAIVEPGRGQRDQTDHEERRSEIADLELTVGAACHLGQFDHEGTDGDTHR